MSETSFPINDVVRRRLQTSLVIVSLTLSTGSTAFLFLFGGRVGLYITTTVEGRLTVGSSRVFSSFLMFVGLLAVMVGVTIVSFMVYVMMSQRVKDVGLMKAMGCSNSLIFGYYLTELLVVTSGSCVLGIALGVLGDYTTTVLFSSLGFQTLSRSLNAWLILLVLLLFFVVALICGAKPILDTVKVQPTKAISPIYHLGLGDVPTFKVVSRRGFVTRVAVRSLFRRKSGTLRIVLCLSVIFALVTVVVAGGIIAEQTMKSWIVRAMNENVILIAHQEMSDQYKLLLSKFHGVEKDSQINYADERYLISQDVIDRIRSHSAIDQRLVLEMQVGEVPGYIVDEETSTITSVGDHRNATSLIVGVDPTAAVGDWFLEGEFLGEGEAWEAVIGDSLSHKMFSMPLIQSISLAGTHFEVSGVCVDPINNGYVTYVPLKTLQDKTGLSKPNIIMVKVDSSTGREDIVNQIRGEIEELSPALRVSDLNPVMERNLGFIGYLWTTIRLLPLFLVTSASLCLVSYVVIAITEQRREFGVLRAVGLKPKTVVKIISEQSLIVLISSFCVGIPVGIITTLLILVPEPVITTYTILEVAGWLLASLVVLFVSSLYPATRFGKKPILDLINDK